MALLEGAVDVAEAEAEAAREEQEKREDVLDEANKQLAEATAQLEEIAQLKMLRHRDSESWLVNMRDSDWDTNLSTGDETFLVDQ